MSKNTFKQIDAISKQGPMITKSQTLISSYVMPIMAARLYKSLTHQSNVTSIQTIPELAMIVSLVLRRQYATDLFQIG